MWDKLKEYIMNPGGITLGVLSFVYLSGWFTNGYLGTKFDLAELRQFIIWMYGFVILHYGIDSGLNTPFGQPPYKGGMKNDSR